MTNDALALDPAVSASGTGSFDNAPLQAYVRELKKSFRIDGPILLVQTLQCQLDAFNVDVARNRAYYAYPPSGLQCIAKAVAPRGVEVDVFDLNFHFLKRIQEDAGFDPLDWLSVLDEQMAKKDYAIVGVTCIGVVDDAFKPTHPLGGVLKHVSKKDRCLVVAGGTIATDEREGYLERGWCHFVVGNEGENKFNFLLDHLLDDGCAHPATPGVYFRHAGAVRESAGLPDVVDLEGNLVETFPSIPIEDYHNVGSLNPFSRMVGREVRYATPLLNRGCRANCMFCGVPKFMGRGVRQMPYQDLLDEFKYLIEERGVRHFEWLDDDLLGPAALRDGVEGLLEGMAALREKYGITWSAGNGLIAATVNENIMRLIHASGCVGFRIGVESGNEGMLKRMRKPASRESTRRFAALAVKYPDIFIGANYIIGLFSTETFGEMLDTYRFSCELDVDWASYSTYQFTSRATTDAEKLKGGEKAAEFVPSRDVATREIRRASGIRSGLDVFSIPEDSVPSKEQVKELWFVFNLLSNYVDNKNLKPGGNPKKLVSWLEAIRISYPKNPYMPLFAGLCRVLLGEPEAARAALENCRENLSVSEYWRERFAHFQLDEFVDRFPATPAEVHARLDEVRSRFPIPKQEFSRS